MEESLKNRVILILGILCVILFVSNISSCGSAARNKNARDKEMATRLDLEERMSKFTQDKAALEAKASNAMKDLEEQNKACQVTKKELTQEQLVNQSLKDELQKVTKLKEKLEDDLKSALAANKSAKSKK